MYLKISKKWQFVIDIIMIVLGTFVMGFAFSVFLEPNSLSTGGFSGLSMIVNTLLNLVGITFVPTSLIYLILNVGLFLYAVKKLGKKFAIKAIIGIVAYSGAMQIFALIPFDIKYETLISAIYGGALMGVGTGLVVRFGGSTGGSDMIASIVKNKSPNITIGSVVIIVDIVVILLSLFVFVNGIIILPYTLIALMLCKFTTDFVDEGYKQVRAFYIITTKPTEVGDKILNKLHRGCTATKVNGMYSNEEKYVLLVLVSKFQSNYLKRLIKDTDSSAFVYTTAVNEVIGSWMKGATEQVEKKSKKKATKNEIVSSDEGENKTDTK